MAIKKTVTKAAARKSKSATPKKASAAAKKTAAKKATVKKTAAKKAVKKTAKKTAKKTPAKKTPAKKVAKKAVKKAAPKKTAAKKAAPKKTVVKKAAKKKTAAKKTAPKRAATKKAAKKKAAPKDKSAATARASSVAPSPPETESAIVQMEASKYQVSPPTTSQPAPPLHLQIGRELPAEYGDTRLVLLPRDPEWIFAYWEINEQIRNALDLPRQGHDKRMVIRTYDITGIAEFSGINAHHFFDIDINDYADSWYIRAGQPNRHWCADLGLINATGEFIQIVRSNPVQTPADDVSDILDEEWMVPEEQFERMLGLPEGALKEAAAGSEGLTQKLALGLASGAKGVSGGASEQRFPGASALTLRPAPESREFGLTVNAGLVLYGATQPGATVTIQGQDIEASADGTFSARFALPDGEQVIPVSSVSENGKERREVTTTISKTTHQE